MIFKIAPENHLARLDHYLVQQLALSRSYIQKLIESGRIRCNAHVVLKSNFCVKADDVIEYEEVVATVSSNQTSVQEISPPDIWKKIEIIFSNDDFMVINKPAGLIVHPAYAHDKQPSLSDWISFNGYFNDQCLGDGLRQGIVHRLDKDTSGVILIARNYKTQSALSLLFQNKTIQKEYIAIVENVPNPLSGAINYGIMRDPACHVKMTHSRNQGREATTHYETIYKFDLYSVVKCRPTTGRTHQIRVHMASIECPLVGDTVYGKMSHLISRHALHASRIAFTYQDVNYDFYAVLPEDMKILIDR